MGLFGRCTFFPFSLALGKTVVVDWTRARRRPGSGRSEPLGGAYRPNLLCDQSKRPNDAGVSVGSEGIVEFLFEFDRLRCGCWLLVSKSRRKAKIDGSVGAGQLLTVSRMAQSGKQRRQLLSVYSNPYQI